MSCRTINVNISNVEGAALTGLYDMTDNNGDYVFQGVDATTLIAGLTFSISDTAYEFYLTNYSQSGTWSSCNPIPSAPIYWQNTDNVIITNNGHTLVKSGSIYSPEWNQKCWTQDAISVPFYVEWTVANVTNNYLCFGFSPSPSMTGTPEYTSLQYSYLTLADCCCYVQTYGSFIAAGGAPSNGSIAKIENTGTQIKYYLDNVLQYTQDRTESSPLYVCAMSYNTDSIASNIQIVLI